MAITVKVVTVKSGNVTTNAKKIKFEIDGRAYMMTVAQAEKLERTIHDAVFKATSRDLELKKEAGHGG